MANTKLAGPIEGTELMAALGSGRCTSADARALRNTIVMKAYGRPEAICVTSHGSPLIPLSVTVDSGVIRRGSDGLVGFLAVLMGGHDERHTVGDLRHAVCGGVAQAWPPGA